MIADFLEFLSNGVFDFLNGFFGLFPQMPITVDDITDLMGFQIIADVLGWVNYFLPLDIAASIIALWSTAILAYLGLKLSVKYSEKII